MTIREILQSKGHEVVTTTADRTVVQAMQLLVDHGIGAVVVVEGADILGILSERDILRLGAKGPELLATTLVGDAMTADPIVGVPGDRVEYVMEIMTRNRIRHLPIVEDDRLGGIVSIGDVVNALRKDVEAENRHLTQYVQGMVR